MMSAGAQGFLNKAVVDGHVDDVRAGINLPQEFTGEGVIIGITDWGFDYSHPVFYDTNMQNYRVLRAWDQFKTSGPAPEGFDYGTEYVGREALLAAQCDTSNVYQYAYHGTHCAGIAGGAGAGTIYKGVALGAEFLFVSVSLTDQEVIDAWRWMYDVAQQEGKRLVISMSWGLYCLDYMDGTGPLADEMQRLTDLGVLFVTSAGNNGDENSHLTHTFTQQDTVRSNFVFPSSSIGSVLTMMNSANQPFSFSVFAMDNSYQIIAESPFFSTSDTALVDDIVEYTMPMGTDSLNIWFYAESTNEYNQRPVVQLYVDKNTHHKYGIAIAASDGEFHAWNMALIESRYGNWGGEFKRPSSHPDWIAGDNEYTISTPGNVDCAVTVAAHSSRYQAPSGNMAGGQIASFSSYGPAFGQVMKPDISAPGSNVVSALSSYTTTYSGTTKASVDFNGRTYKFVPLSGTSMSCPFVAGVAALVLQANPYLSASQVKDILLETAYNDHFTAQSGEIRFGHGKVNAYQAILSALTTVGVDDHTAVQEPLYTVYPNPTQGQCFVTANTESENVTCQVIDLMGRTVLQTAFTPGVNTLDLHSLTPGCYLLRITDDSKIITKKLVISQ